MSNQEHKEEQEIVYFLDTESSAEKARLMQQGRILTNKMGGLLPERSDLSGIHRVLDVACGPGEWALELAFAHPEIEVTGVDISQNMIEFAREQARIQSISNVDFRIMDITKPLDFPGHTFDLVNGRAIVGVLPTHIWPLFLEECVCILRPGGIIRITDCDLWGVTNSPAYEKLNGRAMKAAVQAGVGFSPDGKTFGITPMLKRLLHNAGCTNIQERPFATNFSAGESAHNVMCKDIMMFFQLSQPILIRYGAVSKEEFEELFEQMLLELLSDDFCGINYFLTVWGEAPQE